MNNSNRLPTQRCNKCQWWERIDGQHGECRYGPPVAHPSHRQWPLCDGSDWCRMWEHYQSENKQRGE